MIFYHDTPQTYGQCNLSSLLLTWMEETLPVATQAWIWREKEAEVCKKSQAWHNLSRLQIFPQEHAVPQLPYADNEHDPPKATITSKQHQEN